MPSRSEIELTPNRSLLLSWSSDSLNSVVANVGTRNSDLYRLFIESYVALLLDSPCDTEKPVAVLRRFFYELLRVPAKAIITRYASLADAMLESMSVTSDYTINGEFLDEMKDTPIFREYLTFYRTGDPVILKFILTFLYFGKKMDFMDPTLESAAFRDWLGIEQEMDNFSIPVEITDHLAIIIRQLVPDFDDSVFLPRHGPGYTAEGFLDPHEKLDNLSLDEKSTYVFRSTSFGRTSVDRGSLSPFLGQQRKEQVAKLRFVPKNVKTMRSICMEPISRMYLQQEVARWLINTMEQTSLRYLVTLRDQTPNQRYALGGSASNSCDTIDLSAASDRVHIGLVRSVFPKKILFYLLGTRTSIVETKRGRIELNKFAPMGSALCFPIESIVFASITLLGYLMHYYNCKSLVSPSKDWFYLHHIDEFIRMMHDEPLEILHLLRPRIYGDDIICDYRTTDDILILLSQCGLKVNSQKSFIGGSPFRESCGVFAFNGEDVTPLLFRVPWHRTQLNAEVFASLIGAINRAGEFGYTKLRSSLIHYVKRSRVVGIRGSIELSLPFTTNRDEFGIYTNLPHPPKRVRYNAALQRDEKRVLIIRQSGRRNYQSPFAESYFYDQWMRARVRGGSDEDNFSSSRIRPRATRVRLGWTPV